MYGQVRDAIQSIYSMQENLKAINRRQEEVILRLEKKLEASEAKEKEREEKCCINEREEKGRREQREDQRRDDRGRSRRDSHPK